MLRVVKPRAFFIYSHDVGTFVEEMLIKRFLYEVLIGGGSDYKED